MQSKLLYYLSITSLILIGAWGIWHIGGQPDNSNDSLSNEIVSSEVYSINLEPSLTKHTTDEIRSTTNKLTKSRAESILQLIQNGQALIAVKSINENHSNLSKIELDSLRSELLNLAFQTSGKSNTKNILLATSQAYDDLEVWKYLADASASDNDWETAFRAYFRASELENNPADLHVLLMKLVVSSSHLRSNYEGNNDLISVKDLYQRLTDLHPNFQRFQYELALSTIKIGETEQAKQILQNLIYDPELGDLSKQALSLIASRENSANTDDNLELGANETNIKTNRDQSRANDIVVPLISVGSSFIVNSRVDQKPVSLLLDTGASITSLSNTLIQQLNLRPTGQTIRLSTANGVTNSRIYQVKRLRLGSLVLRDMLIAEINLSNNRSFQGLLGTDALNQLQPQYSYLIDNQKSALIFRKR